MLRGRHPDGRPAWLLSLRRDEWAVLGEAEAREHESQRDRWSTRVGMAGVGAMLLVGALDLPSPRLENAAGLTGLALLWGGIGLVERRFRRRLRTDGETVAGLVEPENPVGGIKGLLLGVGLPLLLLTLVLGFVRERPALLAAAAFLVPAIAAGWFLAVRFDRRLRRLVAKRSRTEDALQC